MNAKMVMLTLTIACSAPAMADDAPVSPSQSPPAELTGRQKACKDGDSNACYEEKRDRLIHSTRELIKRVVEERFLPAAKAGARDSYYEFDRSLENAQVVDLREWSESGSENWIADDLVYDPADVSFYGSIVMTSSNTDPARELYCKVRAFFHRNREHVDVFIKGQPTQIVCFEGEGTKLIDFYTDRPVPVPINPPRPKQPQKRPVVRNPGKP